MRWLFERAQPHYDLCGKGIELTERESIPKSIREAVQQLRFGIVHSVVDDLQHQARRMLGRERPLFVLVPVIVTTAELWRLRPGTDIETIRGASALEDVAERRDVLILHEEPDNELRRYTREHLVSAFAPEEIAALDDECAAANIHSFDFYVERFASNCPALYVVIHYNRFRDAIANLLAFFRRPDSIVITS